MKDAEIQECLAKLQSLIDDIDALVNLIGDRQVLTGAPRAEARAMLTQLKGRLQSEHAKMSTVKGRAALTEVEDAFYRPAVHGAMSNLKVRTDSIPGELWMMDLMSARTDLDFHAGHLRMHDLEQGQT